MKYIYINKVCLMVKVFLLFHLFTFSPLSVGAASKTFTLVIDAGHGGRDTGAIGKGKVSEGNLYP